MIKPADDMLARVAVLDTRMGAVEKYQARLDDEKIPARLTVVERYQSLQGWIWWAIAASVGGVVLERFVRFFTEGGMLSGPAQ